MPKAIVTSNFIDKHTRQRYGDGGKKVFEGDEKRIDELRKKGFLGDEAPDDSKKPSGDDDANASKTGNDGDNETGKQANVGAGGEGGNAGANQQPAGDKDADASKTGNGKK